MAQRRFADLPGPDSRTVRIDRGEFAQLDGGRATMSCDDLQEPNSPSTIDSHTVRWPGPRDYLAASAQVPFVESVDLSGPAYGTFTLLIKAGTQTLAYLIRRALKHRLSGSGPRRGHS